MGKPGTGHAVSPTSEYIGGVERTGGSEPSQYPQEEKATAIPSVAASERGTAQTIRMSSVQALFGWGRGSKLGSTALEPGSYKLAR